MVVCMNMEKQEVINRGKEEKRHELIWALYQQGWTHEDIADILRPVDRSNITRIVNKMPDGWQTKWIKRS